MRSKPIILAILLAFALSTIPYFCAELACPQGKKFLGQIAFSTDQNMYFSFIRQASDGKWIFNNRLTHVSNPPVFVNLEFLSVGSLMRWFHLSENLAYHAWRVLGAVLLVSGFAFLSILLLPTKRRQIASLLLFALGGGFGLLVLWAFALGLITRDQASAASLDLWVGIHPFHQIATNPNFALPHGLMLWGFAVFILAEKRRSLRYYVLSGLIFSVSGLIRPYDLISVLAVFPAYALIEAMIPAVKRGAFAQRFIPPLTILPVLAYTVWLFKFNGAFRQWSIQGSNAMGSPSPYWFYIAAGAPFILACYRLLCIRTQPLTQAERFLLVWFLVVNGLSNSGHLLKSLGFSPQLGIPLMAPLVLLGLSTKTTGFFIRRMSVGTFRSLASAVIAFSMIVGNLGVVGCYSVQFLYQNNVSAYYADVREFEAWRWMSTHLRADPAPPVVLALPVAAARICKYCSVSTVASHYSVTPDYEEALSRVRQALNATTPLPAIREILQKLNVSYLYIGQEERAASGIDFEKVPWLSLAYRNDRVTIYRLTS